MIESNNATQPVTVGRDLWGYIIGAFGVVIAGIAVASIKANSASVELVQQVGQERAQMQAEQNAMMRDQIRELSSRVAVLEAWEARRKQLEAQKK